MSDEKRAGHRCRNHHHHLQHQQRGAPSTPPVDEEEEYRFPPNDRRPSISMSAVPDGEEEAAEEEDEEEVGNEDEDERFFLELPRMFRSPRNSLTGGCLGVGGGLTGICGGGGGNGSGGGGADSSSRNNSGCSVGSNASSTISWSSLQALRLAAAKARSTSLPHHGCYAGPVGSSGGNSGDEEAEMQAAVYEYSMVLAGTDVSTIARGGGGGGGGGSGGASRGATPPTSADRFVLRFPNVSLSAPPLSSCPPPKTTQF